MAENLNAEAAISACSASPRLNLRRATEADCQLLWEWCNDPAVRAYSFEAEPITFAEHRRWLGRKIVDPCCLFFIVLNGDGAPLGQVRYDLEDEKAVVSASVDYRLRGRGYGIEMIRQSAAKIFSETNVNTIHAFIKTDNEASIRAFEKSEYRLAASVSMRDQPALELILERNR